MDVLLTRLRIDGMPCIIVEAAGEAEAYWPNDPKFAFLASLLDGRRQALVLEHQLMAAA